MGLQVGDGTKDVTVVATGLSIHDNDDTGLIVWSDLRLLGSITGATIRSNKDLDHDVAVSPGGEQSEGGRVILCGQSPGTFVFQDSKVYSNSSDQVGVVPECGAQEYQRRHTAAACDATANTFTCRDVANAGYAVYSTGASVAAGYDSGRSPRRSASGLHGPVTTTPYCGVSPITCL